MKKLGLLGILLISLLTLFGCHMSIYTPNQINETYLNETWVSKTNINPNTWTTNVDSWYFTGQPNKTERLVKSAPPSQAITTMSVQVPDFTNVEVDGNFQIQLVGAREHNSALIMGSNDCVRQIVTEIKQNTLYIHPVKDSTANMSNVIIRISVRNLQSLTNLGQATILGREIISDRLTVMNCAGGCIVLNGQMNVTKVSQIGSGTVTIFGACTPNLQIDLKGDGNINISGHVGVQTITHYGNGNVIVLGTDTDALTIDATGNGNTIVVGSANLKKLTATDNSHVYVSWVNSNGLYLTGTNNADIGLAGRVSNASIELSDAARLGGQYLHADSIYVKTRNAAHANVIAEKKIFAAANNDSSIYFYGSPNIVSRYTALNGVVIPVWTNSPAFPATAPVYEQTWSKPIKQIR